MIELMITVVVIGILAAVAYPSYTDYIRRGKISQATSELSAMRVRLEQYYHGGPLFCAKCFPDIPACDDCAWHIPHEAIADHFRKAHTH